MPGVYLLGKKRSHKNSKYSFTHSCIMLHAKYMHVKDTTISVAYTKAQLYMLNIQRRKVSALSRVSLNFKLMYASCPKLKRNL